MTDNDQQQNPTAGAEHEQDKDGETLTWDIWLGKLPDDQRTTATALYEGSVQGLKSALKNERASRSDLEKQLRETAKKLESGSDAQKQMTDMADRMEQANRRADFYELASKPETGIADAAAAWLIINANAEEYIDRKGSVRLDLLKQNHPILFGRPSTPRANAGSGAGQNGAGKSDMNDYIRSRAGRGR